MHMGRNFNNGWDKTICFRRSDDGTLSEPVLTIDNSKGEVLDFITDVMQRADEE